MILLTIITTITCPIYAAHFFFHVEMLKSALKAYAKSTVETLRLSATAVHIHLDNLNIKNTLSRTDRPHNSRITTLLFASAV